MKRFIHLDDDEQPLGEVPEVFVFGSWVDEQLDPFAFRLTITEQNEFHANVIGKQRAAFNKRAGPGPALVRIRKWCQSKGELRLSSDPNSDDVICRDTEAPKGSAFNP
jgi:hypothetical protein